MGLEVSKAARSYLDRRGLRGDPEKTVTFSIRLTEGQHAKLRFIADRFGAPKGTVAQTLLNSAMEDSLRILGTHDAEEAGRYEGGIPPEERNPIIDEYVERYREEIQHIFDEGAA